MLWDQHAGTEVVQTGIAISGQTMASFSSPNETFPLPNSSALSLAVVFVDNSYNEEAIKKISRICCWALFTPPPEFLPAQAKVLMTPCGLRGHEWAFVLQLDYLIPIS